MPDEEDESKEEAVEEVEDEEIGDAQWTITPKGGALLRESKTDEEEDE